MRGLARFGPSFCSYCHLEGCECVIHPDRFEDIKHLESERDECEICFEEQNERVANACGGLLTRIGDTFSAALGGVGDRAAVSSDVDRIRGQLNHIYAQIEKHGSEMSEQGNYMLARAKHSLEKDLEEAIR